MGAPSVLKRWRWFMSDLIDLFHDPICTLSVIRRGRLTLCTSPGHVHRMLVVAGQKLHVLITGHRGATPST